MFVRNKCSHLGPVGLWGLILTVRLQTLMRCQELEDNIYDVTCDNNLNISRHTGIFLTETVRTWTKTKEDL
jgi:hypothetical protein